MNDPDEGGTGSGEDWEITFSPSISSLSSFAPEDYSFPLQQQLPEPIIAQPKQVPNRSSGPQSTSPQRQQSQTRNHEPPTRQQNHHRPDESRQKQRTPPLKHPYQSQLAPSTLATTTRNPPISIPIPNLHTPPPTSPRRKPGILLNRSSSSPSAPSSSSAAAAAAVNIAGRSGQRGQADPSSNGRTTASPSPSPTNLSVASRNSTRASSTRAGSRLGLHTGIGTGVGVGLGAGLPVVSPLARSLPASFFQKAFSSSRGQASGGERAGSGNVGAGTGRMEGESTASASEGGVGGEEMEEGAVVREGLRQRWSWGGVGMRERGGEDLEGGESEGDGEMGGGRDGFGGGRGTSRSSSRDGDDAAAEEAVGNALHDERDDADDEGDGSRTHVEEGSNGYKELERSQGYEAAHGLEDTQQDEGSQGRASEHSVRHEEENFRESESREGYESNTQGSGDDAGERADEEEEERGIRREERRESGDWPLRGSPLVQEVEDDEGDTLPPGRVMLMERLCDLVQRLSSVRVGGGMESDVIEVLNAKVDEMEELLVLAEETAEAEATAEVEGPAEVEEQAEEDADAEAEEQAEPEAEAEAEAPSEIEPQQAEAGSEAKAAFEVEPKQTESSQEGEEAGTEEEEAETQEQAISGPEGSNLASGRSSALPQVPLLQVDDQYIRDLASPLPWLASSFKFSELLISPNPSHPELAAATNEALEAAKRAAQAQAEMAERVAMEAEKLNLELAKVVTKLQARKEESDHLHTLLIDRAESAATRILDLEKEICDLEDDILANESELRHLRLTIRAVETLCYELVRPDAADPELFRSIENWKADWVLVRDRMLERKKDRKERRLRLHRAGCVISSLEQREEEETLTSLGGLSMSVSMLGLGGGRSPRKAY